jgi:hypothetical protein
MDQGDQVNETTKLNKYAFACAIIASMVSIVSGYGKYYYYILHSLSLLILFNFTIIYYESKIKILIISYVSSKNIAV